MTHKLFEVLPQKNQAPPDPAQWNLLEEKSHSFGEHLLGPYFQQER